MSELIVMMISIFVWRTIGSSMAREVLQGVSPDSSTPLRVLVVVVLRESPLIRAHLESGESSLIQRCIGLHVLPLLERYSRPLLTEKPRLVKHLPLQPRREMAHLFTIADTVMSGSHL